MVTYLTARDLEELIRVDKSTIYRMAEDGRLPAVKVGRQWRFPEDAVMGWLGIDTGGAVMRIEHNLRDLVTPGVATAVAELAAAAMGVMVVVTDMDGRPLTPVANPCGLFNAVAADPAILPRCISSWQKYASAPDLVPRFGPSEFGFLCARAFVRRDTRLLGMVIAGGVAPDAWPPAPSAVRAITTGLGVAEEVFADHADEVYHLAHAEQARLLGLLPRVALLVSQIADEAGAVAGKLSAIAELAERRSQS
jgi:excisionase family DNA binding protein